MPQPASSSPLAIFPPSSGFQVFSVVAQVLRATLSSFITDFCNEDHANIFCMSVFANICSHHVEATTIQFLVIFSELKRTDGENKVKQILYYLHS